MTRFGERQDCAVLYYATLPGMLGVMISQGFYFYSVSFSSLENFKRVVIAEVNIINAVEAVNGRVELIEQIVLLQGEVGVEEMITLVVRGRAGLQERLTEARVEEVLLSLESHVGRAGGESDRLTLGDLVPGQVNFEAGVVCEGRDGAY